MNYILYSKNESFKDGVDKIKAETLKKGKDCEILEINTLMDSGILNNIKNNSLVYFLTNDQKISQYIDIFNKRNINIINKNLISENVTKFKLQQRVKIFGVNTPKSLGVDNYKEIHEMDKLKYPIFIKSQRQCGLVVKIEDINQLNEKLSCFNIGEYYFEEAVIDKTLELRKFYYINSSIIDADKTDIHKIPEWFAIVLGNISKALNLDVFSTDVFINWSNKRYSCIDINPASSFYKSDKARELFINKILK